MREPSRHKRYVCVAGTGVAAAVASPGCGAILLASPSPCDLLIPAAMAVSYWCCSEHTATMEFELAARSTSSRAP